MKPSIWANWRRELTRRLTIMVVPHGTARPRQLSFSLPFLLFIFTCWTGFTAWASYVASLRFDYWRLKTNSHLLRIKLGYFENQLRGSREKLDEVKELESQLRAIIDMGSRDAIIQNNDPVPQGAGGPSLGESVEFQTLIQGRHADMSIQEISRQVRLLREEADRRQESFRALQDKIGYERQLYRCTPEGWPAKGYLTSHFGPRLSPFSGVAESHKGLDIAAPAGSPVQATADGTVVLAGWAGGYGKIVVIDHGFGYSTRYGHNRQVLVKRGDRVRRGQIIAYMGSTGNSTGPHCHYEIWHKGRAVNPRRYLKGKPAVQPAPLQTVSTGVISDQKVPAAGPADPR